jgi:hypothetical protein
MNESTSADSRPNATFVSGQTCCPIVELRQYTLHPGSRDVMIELFDREFVESQEALGIKIIGQFRDLDDLDRFVWLRGFRDMDTRAQSLSAFYGGPVWNAHREAANATMVDSDNVLLLRPARPQSGFSLENSQRAPLGTNKAPKGLLVATIYYFVTPVAADFVDYFERTLKPELINDGASILAYFVTERSPNTFPALPVREDVNVLVWFASFSDQAAHRQHLAALARSEYRAREIAKELARRLIGDPEVLKLSPTSRSQLHD